MPALKSLIDELTELVDDIGALGEVRTRELEATQTPDTASEIEVETKNGAIDIHPTGGDDLVVDAIVRSRHEEDDLDAVSIDLNEADDLLSLTVDIPEANRGTSVELDIGVPDGLAVARVATKNGRIDIRDVHGDTLVDTKNGQIKVDNVDGVVDVHAKNGSITVTDTPVRNATSKNGKLDLDLSTITTAVSVEAKNGKLTIAVPADIDTDFSLSAKRGTVTVDALSCLIVEESRSHVSGELGAGGPRLDAQTKNGSVTLRARN